MKGYAVTRIVDLIEGAGVNPDPDSESLAVTPIILLPPTGAIVRPIFARTQAPAIGYW